MGCKGIVHRKRTFVVGDIHGCVDELKQLLDAIQVDPSDTVCFLGDYVDRGPNSKAVIDCLLKLQATAAQCIFLKGNHEAMFLGYVGYPGMYGEAFLWNGGAATLASYGIEGLKGRAAAERLPPAHREFFLGLRSTVCLGEFLCVHAGVRPTVPLDAQNEEDLLWIREDFIEAEHAFPYTVLYGHTPFRDVRLHLPFKVGLDTGVVYGNRLSCLELEEKALVQIERGTRQVLRRSLAGAFAPFARRRA